MACKLDKEYLLHHLAQTGLSQTQRERPQRRFSLGRGGRVSSSMLECKPLASEVQRRAWGRGGEQPELAAHVTYPCRPLLQNLHDRFFCATCTSAQESGVAKPFWAASSKGGSKDFLLLILRQCDKSKKWKFGVTYLVTSCPPTAMNHG